jgi:hypothetical protein
VDRDRLGTLLAAVRKVNRLALDDFAAYASGRPQPTAGGFESVHVTLVNPGAGSSFASSISNWRMAQLYHRLGALHRKSLADGGALRLGALSGDQATLVHEMVFDEISGPNRSAQVPGPRGGPGGRPGQQQQREFVGVFAAEGGQGAPPIVSFGLPASSLMEERTEFLPNGVPAQGTLTLTWEREPAVYATVGGNPSTGRIMSAAELAAFSSLGESLPAGTPAQGGPQYDTFVPFTRLRMNFSFTLTAETSMSKRLEDASPDASGAPVNFQQLPTPFLKAFDEAKQRFANARQRMRELPPTRAGGANPPPM